MAENEHTVRSAMLLVYIHAQQHRRANIIQRLVYNLTDAKICVVVLIGCAMRAGKLGYLVIIRQLELFMGEWFRRRPSLATHNANRLIINPLILDSSLMCAPIVSCQYHLVWRTGRPTAVCLILRVNIAVNEAMRSRQVLRECLSADGYGWFLGWHIMKFKHPIYR